ncbi:MAG: Hsp20/alpha crystallin family protein [Sphingomonadales bacterium]|jgi:HSP20 family protein
MPKKEAESSLTPRGGMVAWHPFDTFQQEMDRWFDRHMPERFSAPFFRVSGENGGNGFAHMDVSESDKSIDVTLDVPGLTEKDLEVAIYGDQLIITGERKTESEKKDKNFHRIERAFGHFERRFLLPCEIDEGKIKANVTKGVLQISLPKSAKAKADRHKIKIESA